VNGNRKLRILGIDPGSRLTGYGVIDVCGGKMRHVTHGTLRLSNTGGRVVIPLEDRLLRAHHGLSKIVELYSPDVVAVERVFFAKNAVSALKLGQARGAIILSAAIHGLSVVEYSPSEVKSYVVGHGQADKEQVARMVEFWLGKQNFATSDASDGLALAICHAQVVTSFSGKNIQNTLDSEKWSAEKVQQRKRGGSIAQSIGVSEGEVGQARRWRRKEIDR